MDERWGSGVIPLEQFYWLDNRVRSLKPADLVRLSQEFFSKAESPKGAFRIVESFHHTGRYYLKVTGARIRRYFVIMRNERCSLTHAEFGRTAIVARGPRGKIERSSVADFIEM